MHLAEYDRLHLIMNMYLVLSEFSVSEMLYVLLTCNIDVLGERRRLLLRGLTESLPEILPLLYTVCLSPKPHYKFFVKHYC